MKFNDSQLTGKRLALSVALILAGLALRAVPSTFTLSPTPFEDGDTVSLAITHGTESDPADPASTLTLVYDFSGEDFSIDPASPFAIDMGGSWFTANASWNAWVTLDSRARTLTLNVQLADPSQAGGFGHVARIGGVIIEIDMEVLKREELASGLAALSVYPVPARERLHLRTPFDLPAEALLLRDMQGRIVRRWEGEGDHVMIPLSGLPAGMYLLSIRQGALWSSYQVPVE